jgi:hypothetical protein
VGGSVGVLDDYHHALDTPFEVEHSKSVKDDNKVKVNAVCG